MNNSLIREDYIQIESVNTIYSYSVSIDNVQFNTTDRNNDLVVEFALDTTYSNTKKIVFSYYRAEIIAPNIDILNKIDPFWAIEIGGNYYVTDCTTGRAMYAEIDAMRIKKTSDLVWHDAGFNAQRYERIAFYNKTNNQLLPYKYARITTTKNLSWTIRYDGSSDYISYNDACYYMSQLRTYSSNYYYFTNAWDNSANVYGANFGNNLKSIYLSISGDYVKAVGGYILNPDANNDIPSCFVFAFTESNGNTKLHTKFASYNLGYYTDVKIYITSYTGEYNFDFDIYLKKFGKIYKKSFHYDNTNHFTFISEIELGIYDSYYRMPNNDYFVVNHGRILYFKDPK